MRIFDPSVSNRSYVAGKRKPSRFRALPSPAN